MSGDRHLRIVGAEPPKPRRRKGARAPYTNDLLSEEEHKRAIQALRNLRLSFGTWGCLAEAMRVPVDAIHLATRRGRVSAAMMFAASKASGLSIADLLGGPAPAERCRACGQVKRRAA